MSDSNWSEWKGLDGVAREAVVHGVMRRTGVPRAQAEDAVGDALVRVMRSSSAIDNPNGLLVTAAVNLIRTRHRQSVNRPALFAIAQDFDEIEDGTAVEEPIDQAADPATEVAQEEERARRSAELHAALERLSPMDRLLLTAFHFEGRSLASLDKEQGNPPGTAKIRVFRARERLRRALVAVKEADAGQSR